MALRTQITPQMRFGSAANASPEHITYTRYCAAPVPREPVGSPRFIQAMLLAAWLGRLINPVDLPHHKGTGKL